jgi:pimeloyl-ACP methyl ester carboxylesterase
MARARRRSAGFHVVGIRGRLWAGKKPPVASLGTSIAEIRASVAGLEVALLDADAPGGRPPILYVHGVPTGSWEWMSFLERTGGVALDLPGFGESAKPAEFDYSIQGYGRFVEAFCDALGLKRLSLVVHDWGAVALDFAQRAPERIERLVLLSCVPFLPGYRWHRIARVWRRPLLGELFMGFSTRWGLRQISREANVAPGPLPDELIDQAWEHFDHGTQRAILKLYRSAPEEVLARAGRDLGRIRCPALVLWPTRDPYIGGRFGPAYADALGGDVELEMVEAGHWSWLDSPEIVERVARFLSDRGETPSPRLG